MRTCAQLLVASLLAVMTMPSVAAPAGDWRSYKLAVMQTVVEVALPYDRLNELTRRDWQVPYRAARWGWILSGTGPQEQVFNGLLDIKGPFWIGGVHGRVDFFGFVNKKPEWFKGDLFDIAALKGMVEREVRNAIKMAYPFHFEIVKINGVQWVRWCSYDPAVPASGAWATRMDRYTRPLTDDLYLEVAIDLLKSTTSENLDWLKTAEPLRERLKNSLVIKYPAGTPSAAK